MQHIHCPLSELTPKQPARAADTAEARSFAPGATRRAGAALCIAALCTACSGESNSVLTDDPQLTGTGGSAASGDSENGNPGAGAVTSMSGAGGTNAMAANGGSESVGGSPQLSVGGSDSGGEGSSCEERTSITLAIHVTVPVTWPATLGTTAGSGEFNLWNLYRLTADGTALSGTVSPCGSTLPPLTLSFLVGGGNTLIEFPEELWDAPSFPEFDSSMTLSGWDIGGTLSAAPNPNLVGLTMADENAAWPETRADVETVDPDADGNPGITGIPATGAGFTAPPVSIIGPGADEVHLVTRTAYTLEGALTSCTDLSGAATLTFFDNHVVGCRTVEGDTCTAGEADFVDANRTIYETMPGTFTARILDEGATCADARAIP